VFLLVAQVGREVSRVRFRIQRSVFPCMRLLAARERERTAAGNIYE
jgi:hypothetical protein